MAFIAFLSAQVEKKKADARRELEALKSEQRGRELVQRRLNRAELEAMQLADQLPGLRNAVHNMASQLGSEQREAAREAAAARQLATEVAALVEEVAAEKKLVGWLLKVKPYNNKCRGVQLGRAYVARAFLHPKCAHQLASPTALRHSRHTIPLSCLCPAD